MAEHKIPAKQLHRSASSKEALTRLLDDCEMGYCTSDKGVYIKHNGELIPVRGEVNNKGLVVLNGQLRFM